MRDHHPSPHHGDRSIERLLELGRDREAAALGADHRSSGTPDENPPGGAMDALEQIDRMGPPLEGAIGAIRPDELDLPTPCARFTVRGVLEHMIEGATAFATEFRGGAAPVAEGQSGDVLERIGPALGELVAAIQGPGALERTIRAPFGDMPGEAFARFIVLDGLMHGWDVSVATGRDYEPPDELVAAAERFARETIDPLRDGDTFADAVDPPAGATPIQRLAAFTGRPVHTYM